MGEQNMGVKKIIITKSAASLVRSALFVIAHHRKADECFICLMNMSFRQLG
jgi:hypothetical protein